MSSPNKAIENASQKKPGNFATTVREMLAQKTEDALRAFSDDFKRDHFKKIVEDKQYCGKCEMSGDECKCAKTEEKAEDKAKEEPSDKKLDESHPVLDNLHDIVMSGTGNTLTFIDGTSLEISPDQARSVLAGFDAIKEPAARGQLARLIGLSGHSFMSVSATMGQIGQLGQ